MKQPDPFYRSKPWYKARQKVLDRAGHRCEMCGYQGKGLTVHHVKPRKEYPMLALELTNLVCVCSSCHNRLHDRSDGTLRDVNVEAIKETEDDGFSNDEWR